MKIVSRKSAVLCLVAFAVLALAGQASAGGFSVWAGPGFLKGSPGGPKTAEADLFFPRRLEVHVGDTVTFRSSGFHTATYLGGHRTTEFPVFAPALDGSTYSGVADAAGSPFYFNGRPRFWYDVPGLFAPSGSNVISGGAAVHNSGILDKKGYAFRFTKAGTYVFHCLVHPMMSVRIVVEPRAARIQSAGQLLASSAAEVHRAVATAKAIDKILPKTADTVYAGVGTVVPGGSIELMTFKPHRLTIKAGTTVTFVLDSPMEIHDVVFGPPDYLKQSFETLDLTPRGPGQPNQVWPFFFFGSDPLAGGAYSYSGSNHGNGFLATPLMGPKASPLPRSFKISFTTPGVYRYICGLHGPDMNGEIQVVA